MKLKKTHYTIVFATFMLSCVSTKKVTVDNFYLNKIPPNAVRISDNLFCDKSEMDNIGWREYMHWTKSIYGSASEEYKSTLLDTLTWLNLDTCLALYTDHYLRLTQFENYPVIGVSQQQAIEYSEWRSDRVFELLLIKFGIIKSDSLQTKENHFSIKRYYKGELKNIKADKIVQYYPEFRLPTLKERMLILNYSDSLNKAYFDRCKSKFCKECKKTYPDFWCDIIVCSNNENVIVPTTNLYEDCSPKKGHPIYHLRGNVNEWTDEKNIAVGGGWHDTRESILKSDTLNFNKPNAWTGFRNVCEWKKWKY